MNKLQILKRYKTITEKFPSSSYFKKYFSEKYLNIIVYLLFYPRFENIIKLKVSSAHVLAFLQA